MKSNPRHRIARRIAVALLSLATAAAAGSIPKWKTPEGSFYFGHQPPPGSVRDSRRSGTAPAVTTESPEQALRLQRAYAGCQEFVKGRLKAPHGAEFPDISRIHARYMGAGDYRFRGFVDSPNSLGVMLRASFSCELHENRDTWRLTRLSLDEEKRQLAAEADERAAREAEAKRKAEERRSKKSPNGKAVDFVGNTTTFKKGSTQEVHFCFKNYTDEARDVRLRIRFSEFDVGSAGPGAIECAIVRTTDLGPDRDVQMRLDSRVVSSHGARRPWTPY